MHIPLDPLSPRSTHTAAARFYAAKHPLQSALLRVTGPDIPPSPSTFVMAGGNVRPATFGDLLERQTINGICPWCGQTFVENLLMRAFAPNPQAGMRPGITQALTDVVVAEYGLTAACPQCLQTVPRIRVLLNMGEVKEAPWYGLENPDSPVFRQFRMIPPKFRWERDFKEYVTLDLAAQTVDVRATLWEPL